MENNQVNPVIVIVAMALLVALVGYLGFRAVTPPTPPAGSYTPGVPPWLDKKNLDYDKVQSSPSGAKPAEGTPGPGAPTN